MSAMLLVLYALLVGAASALAFEPLGWWPLIFVAFAALCELVSRAKSLRTALALGWAFGFGQFVVGLNWIATAFTFQSEMPASLGWVAVVVLSLYLAIYPAAATGIAWRFWRENRVALLLLLAGSWALTEWLRGTLFTGFPWNPAAAAIVPTPLISLSALTGTYGLSAFVILLSGAVWLEVYRRWLPMVVIFGVTLLLWLLPASPVPDDPLAITKLKVVQPNIGQADKWRPGMEAESMRRLVALSGKPAAEPRLILWPEAAITEPLQDGRESSAAMARARVSALGPVLGPEEFLLTGGIAIHSADGDRIDNATNSVFVISPQGKIVGRYDKAHLVPYGEYLPMRPVLSSLGLARLAPGDIDFGSGPGPRTIDIGGHWGRVGFQLCYEIIFSGRVVDNAHRPSFIFNPSNDAWFGSWGPPQHLAQARLRAAEEGVPVIRATPTGISVVIDAEGNVVQSIGVGKAGSIDAVLPPPAPASTFFGRLGNILAVVIGLGLIGGGFAMARGGIARKPRER